jgi:putative peptidoglycan binding protein
MRAVAERALADEPLLRRGSRGAAVKDVQQSLNTLGASPLLDPDGIFGAQTEQAVLFFQRSHRLVVDAIVGPETGAMLEREVREHGDAAARGGAPCHTEEEPGPDDTLSDPLSGPDPELEVAPPRGGSLLGFALTFADAAPGSVPITGGPTDLVVQLTSDDISNELGRVHAGGSPVVFVRSSSELQDVLRKRGTVNRLIIISHGLAGGQIRFDIGTALETVDLPTLASKLRRAATVKQIVFLGCHIGDDKDGLEEVRSALDADVAEGTNCSMQARVIEPPTADGVQIRTQAQYDAIKDANARAQWDKALRAKALAGRGNCWTELKKGQTIASLSDKELREKVFANRGNITVQFCQDTGDCWKDMAFGGKGKRRIQATR